MSNTYLAQLRNTLRDIHNASVGQTNAIAAIDAAMRATEIDTEALRNAAANLALQASATARLSWDIYNAAKALEQEPRP